MEDVYALKYPVTVKHRANGGDVREERIEELSIRRLKAKDLREIDRQPGKMAQSLALIAALTGQPVHVIDDLDVADIEGIGEIIGDFFPGSLGIGARASES